MVLIPILGAMFLDFLEMAGETGFNHGISFIALTSGFVAAFITGFIACTWMIRIVKKGKLIYFAIYCFIIGLSAIVITLLNGGTA